MKLPLLLAQYLYSYKKLSLPGLGVFFIDDGITIPDIHDKNFSDALQHIQFLPKNILRADDELIEYVRKAMGKIKPLAESDIEAFVEDGKLMMNLSKPFHLDGIGTLQKNKTGQFIFTPGEPALQKLESVSSTASAEPVERKKSVFEDDPAAAGSNRKYIIAGLILIALVAILWGGYSLYRQKAGNNEVADNTVTAVPDNTQPTEGGADLLTDSLPPTDTPAAAATTPAAIPQGSYKFIIETTNSKWRALHRYEQLKSYFLPIQLETKDSVKFKLYFAVEAQPADTSRIKDSLQRMYARPNTQVWIERP